MTGNRPYDNPALQASRRAVIENDQHVARKRGLTFHAVALGETDMVSGRYAAREKSTVTGSGPAYPRLPEASPWHCDPVPPEPSLGVAIDATEPVGTHVEIEQSLREASDGAAPPSTPELTLPGDRRSTGSHQLASKRRRRLSRKG